MEIEKFKLYLSTERVQWVKEFVLFMCSAFGNIEFLKVLLDSGLSLKSETIKGESALIFAAGNGFIFLTLEESGFSILFFCFKTFLGHFDCLNWMLEHGMDIHYKKETGETCLHYAAHNGHMNCVALLIEKGADINATNKYHDKTKFQEFSIFLKKTK